MLGSLLREEPAQSPNRGFQRWFSDIASAGRDLKRVARETRDAMVLLRHSAKHGEQASVPAEGAVQVELLAAADLSYAPLSSLFPSKWINMIENAMNIQ